MFRGNSIIVAPKLVMFLVLVTAIIEDRPIVCRISSSTFGQNYPTLQSGLSVIAELLVHFYFLK